jgi:hypothetical protein
MIAAATRDRADCVLEVARFLEWRVPFQRASVLRQTGRQAARGCNVFSLWIDPVMQLSGGSDAAWRSM